MRKGYNYMFTDFINKQNHQDKHNIIEIHDDGPDFREA